jgi:hypothetical protein
MYEDDGKTSIPHMAYASYQKLRGSIVSIVSYKKEE